MPCDKPRPLWLRGAAYGGLLFLNLPVLIIVLYAFTKEESTYQFPPPGLTLRWFAVAAAREDIYAALFLSLKIAGLATAIAGIIGTMAALVTIFTAGAEQTLPIWFYAELFRPRARPVTNVVAVMVMVVTFVPILLAQRLTRGTEDVRGASR